MSQPLDIPDFPPHRPPIDNRPPENVSLAITAKYNSLSDMLGGADGFRMAMKIPGTNGWRASFKNGEIYWLPESGAVAIYGAIWNKWKSAGSLTSHLAYPVSDIATNVPGAAAFQAFKNGAISMQAGGADFFGGLPVMIYGNIYLKWLSLGGPQSNIGVPTNDETGTADGAARYNTFSNGGAIYWTPAHGAFVVYGVIYQKYLELGAEAGFLGYPLTDELPSGHGRYNDFSGGFIYFSGITGLAHAVQGPLPTSIDFPPQNYTFPEGIALGGSSHVTVFSSGQAQFEGQFHDSGSLAYDVGLAVVLIDADRHGYSFSIVGHVAGTFESGSRDYIWNTSATNGLIAENWRAIVASHALPASATESTDVGALISSVANVAGIIGTAAAVIALL